MSDSQDSSDEIQTISQRLKTVTTIDSIVDPQCGSGSYIITTPRIITNTSNIQSQLQHINNHREMEKPKFQSGEMRILGNEDNELVRSLPELNLPERIILIIDVTQERECTKFKLGTGATYMPMFMIKRVIEIFIGAKSMIKQNHEFAILTLHRDLIKWKCDFTNNTKTVLNALDSIVAVEEEIFVDEDENTFDLSQIFEALHPHVPPIKNIDLNDPPAYVTRAILIYSRSNCIPKFQSGHKYFQLLSDNPYFILDSLFVHEPPSDDNKCEEVYTELAALDAKNLSYILEVGRNATKLHDNMAKLLAHPLQRPLQRNASYTICIPGNLVEEIQTIV